MSLWPLLEIGLVAFSALLLLMALCIRALLGRVAREVSDLLDVEPLQRVMTVAASAPRGEAPARSQQRLAA